MLMPAEKAVWTMSLTGSPVTVPPSVSPCKGVRNATGGVGRMNGLTSAEGEDGHPEAAGDNGESASLYTRGNDLKDLDPSRRKIMFFWSNSCFTSTAGMV